MPHIMRGHACTCDLSDNTHKALATYMTVMSNAAYHTKHVCSYLFICNSGVLFKISLNILDIDAIHLIELFKLSFITFIIWVHIVSVCVCMSVKVRVQFAWSFSLFIMWVLGIQLKSYDWVPNTYQLDHPASLLNIWLNPVLMKKKERKMKRNSPESWAMIHGSDFNMLGDFWKVSK